MEDELEAMPLTLHEAFDETVSRTQRQPEGCRRQAVHILMWLSHTTVLLTFTEFSGALGVRVGQTSLHRRYCPSQKSMTECCFGLATVDEESSTVRLAHYSVQEYLMDRHTNILPFAEAGLAETCLTYLYMDPLSQGFYDFEEEISARIAEYPFLPYATSSWGYHVRRCRSEKVLKLAVRFLISQPRRAISTQIYTYTRDLREYYWIPGEVNSVTGLHVASSFGLQYAARDILAFHDVEIDAKTRMVLRL